MHRNPIRNPIPPYLLRLGVQCIDALIAQVLMCPLFAFAGQPLVDLAVLIVYRVKT